MTMGRSSSPTHQKGAAAEEAAALFLRQNGLVCVAQNFNTRLGEIDLIMLEKSTLVFIEVRQRKANSMVSALESVTKAKQRKIACAAAIFLQQSKQYQNFNCRFDVIACTALENGKHEFDWIKGAFYAG